MIRKETKVIIFDNQCFFLKFSIILPSDQLPVSAAGLVTVLYWFCVEMMLDLGLRAGEDSRDSSSTMLLLRGWFLGSSLSRCSKEYRSRSSF